MFVVSLCGFISILFSLLDIADSNFSDLGRELLGGFVFAVILAVVLAILHVRRRDQDEPARFISITQTDHIKNVKTDRGSVH